MARVPVGALSARLAMHGDDKKDIVIHNIVDKHILLCLLLVMQAFSNSTGYAIRALACLCEKGCSSRLIREIAECSGVPAPYLAKLVRKLAEAGIVHSKRGYKGGVQLARLPEEITLLELARAIDGPQDFDRCLLGLEACSDARACPAHAFWEKTREDIRNTLRRTTLAEVIEFEGRRGDARRTKSAGEANELPSRFRRNPAQTR